MSHQRKKTAIFSFLTPAEPARIPYCALKNKLSRAASNHKWFEAGELLDTLEKGVMYPIIHRLELPPHLSTNVNLLEPSALGKDFTLQQGWYTELERFEPPMTFIDNSTIRSCHKRQTNYIVLGFKTLEETFNEVLEDSWKDWTGARLIYLNLPDDLGLSRMVFYRRIKPKDIGVFMYIMVVECSNVTYKNRIQLLDFVQRLRVERMLGYLSVYQKVTIDNNNVETETDYVNNNNTINATQNIPQTYNRMITNGLNKREVLAQQQTDI